jgi:hypothetical protein
MSIRSRWAFVMALGWTALALPGLSLAQMAEVAGTVTYAEHAKNPAGPITAGATLFAGDLVQTEADGKAQIQASTIRLTLFGNSSARLFPSGTGVAVELERGTIVYSASATPPLLVYALDLRIRPIGVPGAVGQITIVATCDVRVISQHGQIEILGGKEKQKRIVEDTKSENFASLRGVDYRDTWKPIRADYPDIDPNSQYHHSHNHAACPTDKRPPPYPWPDAALAGFVGVGTFILVHKELESRDCPDKNP